MATMSEKLRATPRCQCAGLEDTPTKDRAADLMDEMAKVLEGILRREARRHADQPDGFSTYQINNAGAIAILSRFREAG